MLWMDKGSGLILLICETIGVVAVKDLMTTETGAHTTGSGTGSTLGVILGTGGVEMAKGGDGFWAGRSTAGVVAGELIGELGPLVDTFKASRELFRAAERI